MRKRADEDREERVKAPEKASKWSLSSDWLNKKKTNIFN